MRFKQFLAEDFPEVSVITPIADISIADPNVRERINQQLDDELQGLILSPESGIQRIRKILHISGLDMPALYDCQLEGDEIVFELDEFGRSIAYVKPEGTASPKQKYYYLYMIYYLTDDGRYEFFAELTDEEGLSDILSDEEEDEE